MNKHLSIKIHWLIPILSFFYHINSYGSYPLEGQHVENLTISESLFSDPIVNVTLNNSLDHLKGDAVSGDNQSSFMLGAQFVSTHHSHIFNIPASYGRPVSFFEADERISFNANLAYVDTSNPALPKEEASMGDASIGVDYHYYNETSSLMVFPALTVKLATGDEDKGLGTGSTDIATSIVIKKSFSNTALNAKVAYMYKGEGKPSNIEWDYGDVFALDISGRHEVIPGLWLGVNAIYLDQGKNENKTSNTKSGAISIFDLIPTLTYRFKDLFNINTRYAFSISENVDKGATEPDRENSFSLSITRDF